MEIIGSSRYNIYVNVIYFLRVIMELIDEIPAINRIKGRYNLNTIKSVLKYYSACKKYNDKSLWTIRMYTSLNLFLWHIDEGSK